MKSSSTKFAEEGLQAALETAKEKKVVYIDTEGGFSSDRIMQLNKNNEILDRIILLSPKTFEEQNVAMNQIANMMNDKIGLVIIDSIAMLYRLQMHKAEDIQIVNRQLGIQLALLTEITRKYKIPILITNQVYARFDDRENIHMVGGDLLKYSSKCLVELQRNGKRKAILHKHRSIQEGRELFFDIKNEGTVIL